MGQIPDSKFRSANGIRQYLREKVRAARDLVYHVGHAVAGACVNGLLKATSSVPTIVSQVSPTVNPQPDQVRDRILSVSG